MARDQLKDNSDKSRCRDPALSGYEAGIGYRNFHGTFYFITVLVIYKLAGVHNNMSTVISQIRRMAFDLPYCQIQLKNC